MVDITCGAVKCTNNKDGKCVADSIQVNRVQGKPLASCKSFSAPRLQQGSQQQVSNPLIQSL